MKARIPPATHGLTNEQIDAIVQHATEERLRRQEQLQKDFSAGGRAIAKLILKEYLPALQEAKTLKQYRRAVADLADFISRSAGEAANQSEKQGD